MARELEAYEMLKSLGNYLKADLKISSGTIERKVRGRGIGGRVSMESEGHNIKVTISNTAPVVTNWPAIVFTGVGLVVNFDKYRHETFKRMRDADRLKVDLTNAPQSNPYLIKGSERVNGTDYPAITSDEERHGYVLFPGCSITYEVGITARECPDINKLRFWVEGNISRRHLLHFSKELTA